MFNLVNSHAIYSKYIRLELKKNSSNHHRKADLFVSVEQIIDNTLKMYANILW